MNERQTAPEPASERIERRPLRTYQRKLFGQCLKMKHPALFVEMRLGKTLITVRRIKSDASGAGRILIVGPYSCLYSWERELLLEGFTNKDIVYVTGPRSQRLDTLNDSRAVWFLANVEARLSVPELCEYAWEEVVLDESTFVKAPPQQKWSKTFGARSNTSKYYTDNFRNVRRRWALTGTPAPESELDYYMQLRWLSHEILPFANYHAFKNEMFATVFQHDWVLTERGRLYLSRKLAEHCAFLKRKDVDLCGRKIYTKRLVQLDNRTRKMYNTMVREQIMEIDGRVLDVADYSIESYTWARQLLGGFVQGEFVHRVKVDELTAIVCEQLAHEQIVIWCDFTAENIFLVDYLTKKGVPSASITGDVDGADRPDILRAFERGDYRVLVCQPKCMSHGTDMSAADTMIFYSTPLGLERRLQCEDRCYNVSADGSSHIIDIVCENTIEEAIHTSLIRKESKAEMMRRIVMSLQRRTA
jgi:SNF2 family DNA or RNA helicase